MMKKKNSSNKNVSFNRFFKMFSGVKMPWIFLILAVASQVLLYYAISNLGILTGSILDAHGAIKTSKLINYLSSYLILTVAMIGSVLFNGFASERINMNLRNKIWKKLMYIPQKYYDKDSGESLVSRITTDCDFASTFFVTIISCSTTVFGIYIFARNMYKTNVKMTLFILLILPVTFISGWLFGKAKYWVGKKVQGTLSGATAYLIERTQNLRLIKASSTENLEYELGNQRFMDQYKADVKSGYLGVVYLFIEKALNIVGILIPFIIGGALVNEGVLRVGQVVAFYVFTNNVTANFSTLIQSFGTIKLSVGSLERVINTLEAEVEDADEGIRMAVPDADIRFENVEFGYGEKMILEDISCIIPKNKTTAIIGANGSGKTTLFKLLERFYEPSKGYIYFGDKAVNKFSRHSWRKAFAIVAQDRPLMEGTIRENIIYGCERELSEEEFQKIVELSRVSTFALKLPDEYDSYVAPCGNNLSGGQKQCIAIARAIAHNPDYLLLDEATSNLDTKSERNVTDALDNLMKNRTTLIIAHSLSAIRHADHVIVIKNGKVAASGAPEEIIKTSNDYRDFVMNQRKAE